MMKAWPVVCCTACAISKLAAFSLARISTATPARVSGPASRQGPVADLAAAPASSGATRG